MIMRNLNMLGFKKFIIDLSFCDKLKKPDQLLDMIFKILLKTISQGREKFVSKINFCPRFKNRLRLFKPVLQAIKGKNTASRGLIADRTDVNIETNNRVRNHATKLLRENRRELESILIKNSEKISKHLAVCLSFFQKRSHHRRLFFIILIEKDVCKAKKFNCIFSSSF